MWIVLTLLTAICTALRDVASKQATRSADPVLVAFGIAAVPALTLGGIVAVGAALSGDGSLPRAGFWLALAVSGGINAVATPLVVVALQRSDLSLVAPLTSLTPLFMLVTGVVVLGEIPGPAGLVGVVVIVVGAYLLTLSARHVGVLAPLRALLRDPGARAMLLVAFLYSISSTYDKVGTTASSPLLWAASINGVVMVVLAPMAVRRRGRRSAAARRREPEAGEVAGSEGDGRDSASARHLRRLGPTPAIVLAGVLAAIAAAAQMTALMLTLAAFVIAVKRTSTLFGVLLGHSLFDESHVRERLVGAAVMLAGFILLTLD